jgi:ribosomal protein S27E
VKFSILAKIVLWETAFWVGLVFAIFSDMNGILAMVYFVFLGSISFFIRCPSCRKGVFVRDWFGLSIFVVPWPNACCTRCGKVLFGEHGGQNNITESSEL